jgi:hypothetical protein
MPDISQNEREHIPPKRLAQLITLSALAIALTHLLWPGLAIDAITLVLIGIAVVPWLAPIFRSLEFPGGWKFEFAEVKKAAKQAEQAGLLAPAPSEPENELAFQQLIDTDPILALAGLRIEIEKRIRSLALKNGIPAKRRPIHAMLDDLTSRGVLDERVTFTLRGMANFASHAIHGDRIEPEATEFVFSEAPRLLKTLDDLANKIPLPSP